MEQKKKIGLVFIDEFADWEFGLLTGSAVEWFGARTVALAPSSGPLRSIGGLHLVPDRGLDPEENADLDAVAVIGANTWPSEDAPDIAPLLTSVLSRGGVVGGICGGTLALARAGLFEGRKHTSNGAGWIETNIGDYAGSSLYQDVPYAVHDGHIVSAPGSAPGTFATRFLGAVLPDKAAEIAEMRGLIAREYQTAS
ncbi:DJ-1/PfpI family protein [Phyllobacterium myrsinacearum]|uniref:Putative intracellular protease/amidase n=1 Tax=Phyllobacterium myrsinacearum TaxID=28101 RepID=A0A839EH00_9HYPH|nr:DJ-1/PfpI family protein [Phyllobacterium myrsinacearum]MBA8878172.1 putative intracellular protease/amidase [Phyllobacterium myrsinacearum]